MIVNEGAYVHSRIVLKDPVSEIIEFQKKKSPRQRVLRSMHLKGSGNT